MKNLAEKIAAYLEFQKEMGMEQVPVKKSQITACHSEPPTKAFEGKLREESIFSAGGGFAFGEKIKPDSSVTSLPQNDKNNDGNNAILLDELCKEIGDCKKCGLHAGRTNLVFGVGNPNAELMFVGEAPGADEDAQGIPFVGRAGQLLTKIIEAMGKKREDVYIGNIIKCRPPENRQPLPDERSACMPFLKKQIDIIKPKVIVCLGSVAVQTLLQTEDKISGMRGIFKDYNGTKLMPTFHPAYLLRNPAAKKDVWEDMKKVIKCLSA